jgi:SAM-dependent methyltransferase
MLTRRPRAASTRSLWEQDLDYREIHGRLYCREYYSPIDDIELMRQALLNQVFLHVLGGEHTGVQLDDPTNILDVGTGTGEWAIRMAEQYQKCEVVGTDIAAVAETNSVPMNVFFEIEDAEDWDRAPDFYDLIHLRSMEGAFKDWRSVYGNIFYSLKPGGWIEVQDFDAAEGLEKFTDQFPPSSHIHKLLGDLVVAAEKTGRRRGSHHMNPGLFVDSGFVDVRVTEYSIPLSLSEKSAGKLWLIACLDAFEAACLRLLTEQMGWDPDRCKQACESVAREIVDLTKNHPEKSAAMITKVRIVAGRKPVDAPPSVRLGRTPSPNTELQDDDDASTQSMAHQQVSSADAELAQQSLAADERRLAELTPPS